QQRWLQKHDAAKAGIRQRTRDRRRRTTMRYGRRDEFKIRKRLMLSTLAVASLLALSCLAYAQSAKQPEGAKARAAASTPDFSGVWQGPTQGQFNRTDIFPEEKGRGF